MATEHLVIVGQRGVGKTTTAVNLSAALAESGKRVLLVGYCSDRSSTGALRGGNELRLFWGAVPGRDGSRYAIGYHGSLCIEAGGLAVAMQGVHLAHPLVVEYDPEYVVHDSSGEPIGPSLVSSLGDGGARLVVVTSADKCSLQVVNRLFEWLNTVAPANCRFGGMVVNNLSGSLYQALVSDFASHTGATITAQVPRSVMVSVSDFYNQTLIESAPFSHVSFAYRKLARSLADGGDCCRPRPLDCDALRHWARKWGDIMSELETGAVSGGLGI